jgi:hypothetical protein
MRRFLLEMFMNANTAERGLLQRVLLLSMNSSNIINANIVGRFLTTGSSCRSTNFPVLTRITGNADTVEGSLLHRVVLSYMTFANIVPINFMRSPVKILLSVKPV